MKMQMTNKSETRKLNLKKETLRPLTSAELRLVAGGSMKCAQGSNCCQ